MIIKICVFMFGKFYLARNSYFPQTNSNYALM
jgi:hypothetical protein